MALFSLSPSSLFPFFIFVLHVFFFLVWHFSKSFFMSRLLFVIVVVAVARWCRAATTTREKKSWHRNDSLSHHSKALNKLWKIVCMPMCTWAKKKKINKNKISKLLLLWKVSKNIFFNSNSLFYFSAFCIRVCISFCKCVVCIYATSSQWLAKYTMGSRCGILRSL